MKKLISGLHRFQKHVFGNHRALFERLSRGQTPEVMLVTCSDSRIVPNMLTQTGPGELFVLRNAGGIVPAHGHDPTGEAATIEFGVAQLGVRDLVVCGHTGCGAMRALFEPDLRESMPALDAWLGHAEATRRLVCKHYVGMDGDDRQDIAAEENVLVQLENLRTHPSVHEALAEGRLSLHGWMYRLETGAVHRYDSETGQYVNLAETGEVAVMESERP